MSLNDWWRLIDSGEGDAFYNMALDEAIAFTVINRTAPPTLRFYAWKSPSISLGYFQRVSDIDLAFCQENNLPVVRRPTGGRAILHGDELTYSFSSTNSGSFSCNLKESYSLIGNAFLRAFRMLGLDVDIMEKRQRGSVLTRSPLCFKSTSLGEISLEGVKLIGSAQRRWVGGFLQQGCIPYSVDEERMRRVFKVHPEYPLEIKGLRSFLDINNVDIKEAISKAFEEMFNVRFVPSRPSDEEILLAENLLREKYLRSDWNLYRSVQSPLMLSDNR